MTKVVDTPGNKKRHYSGKHPNHPITLQMQSQCDNTAVQLSNKQLSFRNTGITNPQSKTIQEVYICTTVRENLLSATDSSEETCIVQNNFASADCGPTSAEDNVLPTGNDECHSLGSNKRTRNDTTGSITTRSKTRKIDNFHVSMATGTDTHARSDPGGEIFDVGDTLDCDAGTGALAEQFSNDTDSVRDVNDTGVVVGKDNSMENDDNSGFAADNTAHYSGINLIVNNIVVLLPQNVCDLPEGANGTDTIPVTANANANATESNSSSTKANATLSATPALDLRTIRDCSLDEPHIYNDEERYAIRMLKILSDQACSLQTYDLIMNSLLTTARRNEHPIFGTTTKGKVSCRDTMMKYLRKNFRCVEPESHQVTLEVSQGPRPVKEIITYDFLQQARDLLMDSEVCCSRDDYACLRPGHVNNAYADFDTLHSDEKFHTNPYRNAGCHLDEIVDSKWYRKTFSHIKKQLVTNNEAFMVFPIIMYIDKTGTDQNQRYPLEPLIFTFGNLRRSVRNKANAWRCLGFIPSTQTGKDSGKDTERNAGFKHVAEGKATRNYHTMLHKVLESFIDNQGLSTNGDTGKLYEWVRIDNHVRRLRVFFPLCFISGDALSGDTLCGRMRVYHGANKCVARGCECTFESLADPEFNCKNVQRNANEYNAMQKRAEPLIMSEEQSKLYYSTSGISQRSHDVNVNVMSRVLNIPKSQVNDAILAAATLVNEKQIHVHVSAFQNVWFGEGNRKGGIFTATPVDVMHQFMLGILKYLLNAFVYNLTKTEKIELDSIVHLITKTHRSSRSKWFPRYKFSRGVCQLTLLTAMEWPGIAFAILLSLLHPRGQELLDNAYVPMTSQASCTGNLLQYSTEDEANRLPFVQSMKNRTIVVEVLERCLAFYAWSRNGPYIKNETSPCDINTVVRPRIRSLMKFIVQHTARLQEKNNIHWQLQKMHDFLHLPDDALRYGNLMNFDAGIGEKNLKTFAKRPALTALKTEDGFHKSVCKQLHDIAVIDKACLHLDAAEGVIATDKLPELDSTDYLTNENTMSNSTTDWWYDVEKNISVGQVINSTGNDYSTTGSSATSTNVMSRGHSHVSHRTKLSLRTNQSNSTSTAIRQSRCWTRIHYPKQRSDIATCKFQLPKELEEDVFEDNDLATLLAVTVFKTVLCPAALNHRDNTAEQMSQGNNTAAHIDAEYVVPQCEVSIFTEWTNMETGVTYRGHPRYRQGDPWYDWAMVLFEDEDSTTGDVQSYQCPSKLICFLSCNHNNNAVTHAVVLPTLRNEEPNTAKSRLCKRYFMSYIRQNVNSQEARVQYTRRKSRRQPANINYIVDLTVVPIDSVGDQMLVFEDYELQTLAKGDYLRGAEPCVTVVSDLTTDWSIDFLQRK